VRILLLLFPLLRHESLSLRAGLLGVLFEVGRSFSILFSSYPKQ
jgi:hypothetical protein